MLKEGRVNIVCHSNIIMNYWTTSNDKHCDYNDKKRKRKTVYNLNKNKEMESLVECNGKIAQNPWKNHVNIVDNTIKMSVYFSDIHEKLINVIKQYGANNTVVGCIAWLSNRNIINTIAKYCKRVLFVVNNEDYSKWGNGKNPELYQKLPRFNQPLAVAFKHLNTPLNTLEVNSNKISTSNYAPVRAYGNPCGKGPLLHSKYLVFFKTVTIIVTNVDKDDDDGQDNVEKDIEIPFAVWTGSINFTEGSKNNQENAQFIINKEIAEAYFNDFSTTFMHSEPITIDTHTTMGNKYNNSRGRRW